MVVSLLLFLINDGPLLFLDYLLIFQIRMIQDRDIKVGTVLDVGQPVNSLAPIIPCAHNHQLSRVIQTRGGDRLVLNQLTKKTYLWW